MPAPSPEAISLAIHLRDEIEEITETMIEVARMVHPPADMEDKSE